MKLHNTLGRKTEELRPTKPKQIKMYSCGPTVYDYMHIGNLRKFVFDDTLRRSLSVNGFEVEHVMNITDVGHLVSDEDEGEDKLEKGAEREGKTVWQVADHYIEAFMADLITMNILPPNKYIGKDPYSRATDFIEQQIDMVKILLDKGFAYQTMQAIYFDVSKLASYGELTGQKLTDKGVGVRKEVVTDEHKHHPQDFAVWFFTVDRFKNHDMHWLSPWGDGFPGWHIECSAIIHTILGDPIDIHTGGVDNIGTHHVNEMAQTEAAFGHRLANYWVHNEHLLVDEHKMSKSAGNFYTLSDITKKGIDPLALRLLFLQSHYRTQMNFTWDNLETAQFRLKSLRAMADLRFQLSNTQKIHSTNSDLSESIDAIIECLADDLDTPKVLAIISQINDKINTAISSLQKIDFEKFIIFLDDALGLDFLTSKDISNQQKELIKARDAARLDKDWKKSDDLRAVLQQQGLSIRDTDNGTIWMRV